MNSLLRILDEINSYYFWMMEISKAVSDYICKVGVSTNLEATHDLIVMNAFDDRRFDVLNYIVETCNGKIELMSQNYQLRYLRLGHFCLTLENYDVLVFLAKNNYDFNKVDFQGNTCMMICATLGNLRMLEFMLENTQFDLFHQNKVKYNIFHEVLNRGEIGSYWMLRRWFVKKLKDTCKYDLFLDMLIKSRGKNGNAVLYIAIDKGYLDVMKDILELSLSLKDYIKKEYFLGGKHNITKCYNRHNKDCFSYLIQDYMIKHNWHVEWLIDLFGS